MIYNIVIKSSAHKELMALPDSVLKQIDRAVMNLSNEPRPRGCVKLKGFDLYRVRVGEYRILYKIDDKTAIVEVISIGHRREVYRR